MELRICQFYISLRILLEVEKKMHKADNKVFPCLVEWYIDNFHNWPDAERSLTPFPIGSNTMYYHKDDGTVIKVSKMPRCMPSNDSC